MSDTALDTAIHVMREASQLIMVQREQIARLTSENSQLRASLEKAMNHLSPRPYKNDEDPILPANG